MTRFAHSLDRYTCVLLALAVLPCAACQEASVDNGPWPMFRQNHLHNGQSPNDGPDSPEIAWLFETTGEVNSSPAISKDGTVYVGSGAPAGGAGHLYAIDPQGNEQWRFGEDTVFPSPAIGSEGQIYFGSFAERFFSLDDSGAERWAMEVGDFGTSSPTYDSDGNIFMATSMGVIHALTPDGRSRWSLDLGGTIWSSPSIGPDGTLYVASAKPEILDDGTVVTYSFLNAVDARGNLAWQFPTEGFTFASSAVADDGTVYLGASDGILYAVNPDGSERWQFDAGDTVSASVAIGRDGVVYIGSVVGGSYGGGAAGFGGATALPSGDEEEDGFIEVVKPHI